MSPTRRCTAWIQAAFVALAVLAVAPRPAAAQLERSAVSGTVTDQQGGVVPGVTITAVQLQTQQPRSTVTDSSGYFTLPSLAPGLYTSRPNWTASRRPPAPRCSSMRRLA